MKEIKNELFHVLATRKKNSINERVNGLNYLFRVYFPKDFAINSVNGEEHAHTWKMGGGSSPLLFLL